MARNLQNNKYTLVTQSPCETKALGRILGEKLEGGEVILMAGSLGAGKTTMVQGMALGLGIDKPVKSPSFVLERIYRGRAVLHHFDFYRLNPEEVIEAGLLWDLDDLAIAVIEWPERAGEALSEWALKIDIEFDEERLELGLPKAMDTRKITLESSNAKWGEILENVIRQYKQENKKHSGHRNKH